MIRLITFEGGDGVGKTTQIRALESYLQSKGRSCVVTREPGGTALGELIRKVVLEVDGDEITPVAELFFYLADRAQHVHDVIRPALKAGEIVLCDRFTDSTLAYQGYGRGIDLHRLRQLNDMASGEVRPDLTFLLDCPVSVGLARTAHRQEQTAPEQPREDRFEREKVDFHEKVRAGFLDIARSDAARVRILDATKPVEEISLAIRWIVDQEFAK